MSRSNLVATDNVSNATRKFSNLAVAIFGLLFSSVSFSAVLEYDSVNYGAWTEVTNGRNFVADMLVGAVVVGQVRIRFDNYTNAFNLAHTDLIPNAPPRQAIRTGASSNPPGQEPASTIDIEISTENITTGWQVNGLSLTSIVTTLAANEMRNVVHDGVSATIEDSETVLDLLVGVGPVPANFVSGSSINFNQAVFDSVNGFNSSSHSLNWGLNVVQGTMVSMTYQTVSVNNLSSENFTFGVDISPIPLFVIVSSSAPSLAAGETAIISFTLSQPATLLDISEITVTGGTLGPISGSGTSFSAVFTPTADSIANGVVNVGNGAFAGVATGITNADASEANNIVTLSVDTRAVATASPIPTLATWAIVSLCGLVGLMGLMYVPRRR